MRALSRARGRMGASAVLAGLVWAAACSSGPTEVEFQVIENVTFHDTLGIVLADFTKLASGVYIRDDSIGTGPVIAVGDTTTVDYRVWLSNGVLIDSGTLPSPPALPVFIYGVTRLIQGFTIGMEGMAEGGTRTLLIPPELGYGSRPPFGSPIPQGAILVFEVDVLDVY